MNTFNVVAYVVVSAVIFFLIEDRMNRSETGFFWSMLKVGCLLAFCYSAPFIAWKLMVYAGTPKDAFVRAVISVGSFFGACVEMVIISVLYETLFVPKKEAEISA